MKRRSALSEFLSGQYQQGKTDSEGTFTLAAGQALTKMAKAALPFQEAWILKAIQAGVASGAEAVIISLFSDGVDVELVGQESWDAELLGDQLQSFDDSAIPGLQHLISALRDQLKEEHEFILTFKGQTTVLHWNGEELEVEAVESPRAETKLSVDTSVEAGSHQAGITLQAMENARIFLTIADNAHLCPIPLIVDGRRVDAVDHVGAEHGRYAVPLSLGWHKGELNNLPITPSWSNKTRRTSWTGLPLNLKTYSARPQRGAEGRHLVEALWVVRAHFGSSGEGQKRYWASAKASSGVYFVRDGVVVDQHLLWAGAEHVTFDLYLSADSLKHDLTGFALLEGKPLNRALQRGREISAEVLRGVSELALPADSRFPKTGWGDWLLQFLALAENVNNTDKPGQQKRKIQEAFLRMRERALLLSSGQGESPLSQTDPP